MKRGVSVFRRIWGTSTEMGVGGKGTGGMISWASILLRCATIRWPTDGRRHRAQGVSARLTADRAGRLQAVTRFIFVDRQVGREGRTAETRVKRQRTIRIL